MFSEWYFKKLHKFEFDREVILAEDGGTLGIDWAIDKDDGMGRPKSDGTNKKPILLLAPGLGGGSQNFYTLVLLYQARKLGYKVGTLLFRGGEGLPITSGKVCYSGSWEDAKTLIEHVHDKYLAKQKMAGKMARLYVYACSLGAQICGLYFLKMGKRACKYVDGAILYGTPWSAAKGSEFFYNFLVHFC